jgi:hypothetical protein
MASTLAFSLALHFQPLANPNLVVVFKNLINFDRISLYRIAFMNHPNPLIGARSGV